MSRAALVIGMSSITQIKSLSSIGQTYPSAASQTVRVTHVGGVGGAAVGDLSTTKNTRSACSDGVESARVA